MLRPWLRYVSLNVLAATVVAFAAETLEEVIKRTDMTNADAVYALAEWCELNNKPTTSRKYFTKVIEIDKDHELGRAKLGQVRIGERWVSAAAAGVKPAGGKADAGAQGGGGNVRVASGPGPTAKDVAWDLALTKSARENPFVDQQIERMNGGMNDSDAMDSAVLTLMRADNRKEMVPRLCAALMRDNFRDLFGTSQIILKMLKDGDRATARKLLPFLTKCSERVTDIEDLETFAYVVPMLRDRKVLPRLIELMDHANQGVKDAATSGFAQLSLQPSTGLTSSRAKSWWDLNHNVPERQWLSEQINNPDPAISVEAAKGLYDLREKTLVPAVLKVLKSDNTKACSIAIDIIRRITGNEWGYDPTSAPEAKAKVVAQLDKWWKENQNKFEWIEDRNAKPADDTKPADPCPAWIAQLSSTEGTQAQQAEGNLQSKGKEAVPALIVGLSHQSPIVRRKCNDILKNISKKDVGFDPRADEDKAAKGIEAWRQWAETQNIALEAEEGADAAK